MVYLYLFRFTFNTFHNFLLFNQEWLIQMEDDNKWL